MTCVIAEPCIDVLDRACVDRCPVDRIFQGSRALCIQPYECRHCGSFEPACPVEAILQEDDVPEPCAAFTPDNAAFIAEPLPGATTALGSPSGAAKLGRLGADTPLVAAYTGRRR